MAGAERRPRASRVANPARQPLRNRVAGGFPACTASRNETERGSKKPRKIRRAVNFGEPSKGAKTRFSIGFWGFCLLF